MVFEIPLFEPGVLAGVVNKLDPPQTLTMLSRLPRNPWPFPTATWDVLAGSRHIANPNIPNSEAHLVPHLGRGQMTASFVYLREKKAFQPTYLHWLRQAGSLGLERAEATVLREVQDLNERFDNFAEWLCWRALTGTISLTGEVTANIDFQVPSSHKPTVASPEKWSTATPDVIAGHVQAWKRLIQRDGKVPATDVWLTEATMRRVFDAYYSSTGLLSDRMRDEYYRTGTLPGFQQLNWNLVETTYETAAGVTTQFVPDDALFITNLSNRALEIYEGPTADDEAPVGFTGKFSKSWKEADPSGRLFLLEWHLLPVLSRPEQVVYVADVDPA